MEKILILGSQGMLGQQLMKVFGNAAIGWDRSDVDATEVENLRLKIKDLSPMVVINCVAYNDVDGAEEHQDLAFKLNGEVPGNLAKICKGLDIILIHFSTNYVFDGEKGEYSEIDKPNPSSVYAKSKYQGELAVQNNCQKYYLVRTAVIFGPPGKSELSKKSFIHKILDVAEKQKEIIAVNDQISSVTYSPDLAMQVKLLLEQQKPFGIYHIVNSGRASWYDLVKETFAIKNIKVDLRPVTSVEYPRKAKVPMKSVLINTKLQPLPPWQEALQKFLTDDTH